MNLLVLSHMFPNKSAPFYGVFVFEQVKALERLNVDAQVISPIPLSPKILWFNEKWRSYGRVPRVENLGGKIIFHPRYLTFPKRVMFERSGWFYYLGTKKLLRETFDKFDTDLTHAHTALPDGQAALYIKKNFGIPFVVTIHGEDLQNTIHQGRSKKEAIKKTIMESEKTIVVSSKLKRIIQEQLPGIPREKIELIANGVDFGVFQFPPRKFPRGRRFRILSVGNLIKIKGHDIFLQTLNELSKKYPVKYSIVGDGVERTNLEKITKDKKLDKVVNFLGSQPHTKIPEFMQKADLFVLPSWNEGFGVVYLEAMASGLPVIGCKGQGIEDFIKDGDAGFLVRPRDNEGLYKACQKILSSPALYELMSQKALRVASRYTWQKNAESTFKVYKRVLTK